MIIPMHNDMCINTWMNSKIIQINSWIISKRIQISNYMK
jgi:hypothetical protein